MKKTLKKLIAVVAVVLAATLALPTTTEAAAKPKLTKTSVKIQKNKKVTVKIKNGKIKSVKSSNKKVASVSYKAYKKNKKNTGVSFTIKGEKKAGKATITVKTTKGKTLKCKVTNKVPKPAPTPAPAPTPTPTPEPTPEPTPTPTPEPTTETETETEEPDPEPTPTPNPPVEDYGPIVTDAEAKAKTLEYFKGKVTDDELKACYRGCYQSGNAFDSAGNRYPMRDIAFKHASEMKPVIQEILALCNGKTQKEQCEAIASWEMANIVVDDYSNSHFTAYSAFTKKPSVCQAYREATEILLSVLGISYDVYVAPGHTWVVAHTDSVPNVGLDFGRIYEGTHSWVLEHEGFTDTTGSIITEENKGAYVLWFDDLTCIEK